MSFITAQQAKLYLQLVPKEKRLEIQKCNGRLNSGKIQREPTFQVVMDALALTPCYFAFLITVIVPEVYMHQFWDSGQDVDALPTNEEIMSFLIEFGHTREINSLNDVVVDQMHQPWRTFAALINRSLFGKTTGAMPPKKARKFKKPASPQLTIVPISPEEHLRKSKRVKRPAKKSTKALTGGFVIRETPKMSLSKKKEKVDVAKGKGVELLSEVALTEDAYVAKIKPFVTNEGTGVKLGVPDVTKEESTKSEAKSWGNDEYDKNNDNNSKVTAVGFFYEKKKENDIDDENTQSDNENGLDSEHETDENEAGSEYYHQENEEQVEDDEEENNDEFVKTPSNDSDSEDETKITNKPEDDEDEEMDYTTSTNVEMINVQQGNENLEISQVVRDAHVTLSIVLQKTEVPVTSSSHSSDLAAKFLNFANIPTTEAKIVSPMDVPVYHEVPSGQTPTLLTVHVSVITKSLRVYTKNIPQSLQSFTPPPLLSTPIPPPTTEATNP
ncbi:hypothetical protein Tco_1144822 [Tanacetum coccineum]